VTWRDAFKDGQWLDAGAEGGANTYRRMVAYCQAFGLELEPTFHVRRPPRSASDR
jgi:hypothetical protein